VAFDGFDPAIVARYDEAKVAELLQNPGIVRNRLKIQAAINNAQKYLLVQDEFGSFSDYLWGFVGGKNARINGAPCLKFRRRPRNPTD
jgi:DNA-3-methyladenine glycosylase I